VFNIDFSVIQTLLKWRETVTDEPRNLLNDEITVVILISALLKIVFGHQKFSHTKHVSYKF